jgi:hypothetical protein
MVIKAVSIGFSGLAFYSLTFHGHRHKQSYQISITIFISFALQIDKLTALCPNDNGRWVNSEAGAGLVGWLDPQINY